MRLILYDRALKKFCSVNYSRKYLLWPVQADRVSNIDVNGNESEILFACTQVKGGILGNSLLNKSLSESQALSYKISLTSLFQF